MHRRLVLWIARRKLGRFNVHALHLARGSVW
jgi:hypothetical protein